MSDIIKFIVDNFAKLQPLDYALILAVVTLCSVAILKTIRGFYKERFQAQADVIQLKDAALSQYQRNLELITVEKESLRKQLGETSNNFQILLAQYQDSVSDAESMRQQFEFLLSNALTLQNAVLRLRVLIARYQVLFTQMGLVVLYANAQIPKSFPAAPSALTVYSELETVQNATAELISDDAIFEIAAPDKLLSKAFPPTTQLPDLVIPENLERMREYGNRHFADKKN